jgi:NitT/TauT family transport system substrate-binding protein
MSKLYKLLFILVFLTGCTETANQPPLQIGINIWPGYAHAFIAQEKGFFKQYGVEVKLIFKRDISEITQLYKSGDLDGMFNVFTDVIMLNSQGVNTQVVYLIIYVT